MNGETYYSYHDHTGTYDNYGLTGYGPGERVIMDKDFNEVKRITFEASDVVEKGAPLDGHDFLMIDLDHYILSGYILFAGWAEWFFTQEGFPGWGASLVASLSPEALGWVYSVVYNGMYMVPEMLLTAAAALLVAKVPRIVEKIA